MFPEGLLYNKEKRVVRTPRINSLFALISSSARVLEENKKGYLVKSSLNSHFVVLEIKLSNQFVEDFIAFVNN